MNPASGSPRRARPGVRARLASLKQRRVPRPPRLSAEAWRQFVAVARPYWTGSQRKAAWGLLGALIVLMLGETWLAVLLNRMTGEMTSALAGHDGERFWAAVRNCLIVIALAVPTFALYYFMRDAFANRWRRWLTARYLDGYLGNRRYYDLANHPEIDNPDQRIAEDINTFTARSANLLLIFLGSAMQLLAFSAVLWSISKVLVAFLTIYALAGTYLTVVVFGSPLIRLNFFQLRREADFRFGLIRLRENAESIAFYRGEMQERRQLDDEYEHVYANYEKLIRKQRSLNLFQRAFSQLTLVVPSVILADSVLSGRLEVGVAVQAGGAFAAVLLAVSVIVDRFDELSRFVAGIDRLHALMSALLESSRAGGGQARGAGAGNDDEQRDKPRIEHRTGDRIAMEGITLLTPQTHRVLVRELSFEVGDGETLLISGPSGSGKSSLLRAMAGLWREGQGTIVQPAAEKMFYLPQRPYMQVGTLREQLLYPDASLEVDDERLAQVLDEVHLSGLLDAVGGLDVVDDWQKRLSLGEQQRVAFARVLVRPCEIVILDEATSALDAANEASLYHRLRDTGATMISIAHRAALVAFHDRVLQLDGEGGWRIVPAAEFSFDDVAGAAVHAAAARASLDGGPDDDSPPGEPSSPLLPLPAS